MRDQLLLPAMPDPVSAMQKVFRLALGAMAEPGTLHEVEAVPRLDSLAPSTYALCLTLLDADTPVWVAPSLDTPALRANLAFHCACPVTQSREEAAFALLGVDDLDDLSGFNDGSDRDPDLSCTLLVQLDSMEGGVATTWRGPGILGSRALQLPVPAGFWRLRKQYAFPKGLDVFFTAGQQLAGLPRSTQVQPAVQGVI
ncbi:MAG: phosphonate C-P lyase system protein PhnH [Burkholderiaceae bacterium]